MATFNPGDLVQISEHQYSSARRNSLEFPIHGNFKPGARVWHSISNEDTGIILEFRPEDAVWLVLFDEVVVEVLKDFTDSKGDKCSWLVPAIL